MSHVGPGGYWSCQRLCGGRGTGIAEEDDLGVFLHNIYLNAGIEKRGWQLDGLDLLSYLVPLQNHA